jgi:hypothetical protein
MADPNDWRPLIRALLYPIIFEREPHRRVDWVLRTIVDREVLGATRLQYQAAIRQSLTSPEELRQLLPLAMNQSEATIRDYLRLLVERLESSL